MDIIIISVTTAKRYGRRTRA
jgi:hypothetical protein